jgi:hypothetical protein
MERSASGRRGVEADEARAAEVRPLHNSIEADEQTWATGGGVGGAKGEDRGKHGRASARLSSRLGAHQPINLTGEIRPGTPTNELLKADFDPSVLLKKVFSTP